MDLVKDRGGLLAWGNVDVAYSEDMDTICLLAGDCVEYGFKGGNFASSGLECNVNFS